jgi:hypothetical protein
VIEVAVGGSVSGLNRSSTLPMTSETATMSLGCGSSASIGLTTRRWKKRPNAEHQAPESDRMTMEHLPEVRCRLCHGEMARC